MQSYSLTHVSDTILLRELAALVAQDRVTTAALLALIAEVDARKLYAPAGYASMHAYCVEELRLSEDAASKRIQAARAARRFPALFGAIADGRLHLSAVCLLAPHLTPMSADELIETAAHMRKSEVEVMLARRFGSPAGVPSSVRILAPIPTELLEHAPGHVEDPPGVTNDEHAPGHVGAPSEPPTATSSETTSSLPERYSLQFTIDKSTHDKLRYAQALLSHALPTGDFAQVLDRALDLLITQLERRKFGAKRAGASRPSSRSVAGVGGRHVPAHVRRAVWERDRGQCTFVSAGGKRCAARKFLEFDHVEPVALGGSATVDGMRLRCCAHNQYEAERDFGAEFMRRKREKARMNGQPDVPGTAAGPAAEAREEIQDVLSGLRNLGCRTHEARRAAEFSATLRGATLEDRMRAALRFLSDRAIQRRQAVVIPSG
jgi:hypothetical protein